MAKRTKTDLFDEAASSEALAVLGAAVDGARLDERKRQQSLFRLFQALLRHDEFLMSAAIKARVPMDVALRVSGETAVPLTSRLLGDKVIGDRITAACWCAATNNVPGLKMLRNAGVDLHQPGVYRRDPLWHAGFHGAHAAWAYLLEIAAEDDVNIYWGARATDVHRRTRLMDMVLGSNLDAVQATAPNASLAAVDADGRTALHLNLLQKPYSEIDQEIGRVLVQYDAPVRLHDHDGISPAALASTMEQQAIIDYAVLQEVSPDETYLARMQKEHIQSQKPLPEREPSDPGFPQIQRPVRFKKPLM